jgi:hypothetical protein
MSLATLITSPALIDAAGHPPKRIEEYVGRASTGTSALSVARMVSPTGWSEPSQIPEFEEITVVIACEIQAELQDEIHVVKAGHDRPCGRTGALQHACPAGRSIHLNLSSGILAGYRTSRSDHWVAMSVVGQRSG